MTKQLEKPCATCPFRRTALRGFLGGCDVDTFVERAQSDARMPCHQYFPLGLSYGDAQIPGTREYRAPQCAGRAIHFSNQIKRARNPNLLVLPADHLVVFSWPHEFREHHAPREGSPEREPPK